MARAIALGVLALALTGCGTVENFTRAEGENARPLEVYGGVTRSVDRLKTAVETPVGLSIPLSVPDVAASAVGDTLTLPLTLTAAAARALNAYYSEKPAAPRKPDEKPAGGHLTPERIHGGII